MLFSLTYAVNIFFKKNKHSARSATAEIASVKSSSISSLILSDIELKISEKMKTAFIYSTSVPYYCDDDWSLCQL